MTSKRGMSLRAVLVDLVGRVIMWLKTKNIAFLYFSLYIAIRFRPLYSNLNFLCFEILIALMTRADVSITYKGDLQ